MESTSIQTITDIHIASGRLVPSSKLRVNLFYGFTQLYAFHTNYNRRFWT